MRRVLYRLPELIAATGRIYLPEGEKDADNLARLGLTATTNPGGASKGKRSKWRDEYTPYLRDRDVVILPDADEAGCAHARSIAAKIASVARSVRILELPGLGYKEDVSDWIDRGGTAEELGRLADAVPPYRGQAARTTASASRMRTRTSASRRSPTSS